ncbi:MAG: Gfo/Idh/MocA family oxidoreductase [Pseudomonadota bacterium]
MTRIAVVGAELIGRRHVELAAEVEGLDVSCIVDPNEDARVFAKARGLAWRSDLREALSEDLADGYIIATPNQMHVEAGLACVSAGRPAMIEKPIADRAEEAARLVAAAEAAGVPLLIGHHRRHNPVIDAAKARIAAGEIGRVVAVNALCWLYKPDDYFDVEWRTQPGAGPVFINLIHDVDLMRWLVGEIVSVQALEMSAARGHAVEDTAAALLRFETGAVGTISVSDSVVAPWSWEMTAAENPAYPESGQSCYSIGGDRSAMEIPSGAVWRQDEPRDWWRPIARAAHEVEAADPLVRQLAHFWDVVEGDAAPLVPGAEGLQSLRVIEAIKEAAATGGLVEVAAR